MSADHYLPCLVRLALIRMRSLIMCDCCPNLWGLFHSVSTLVLSFECPVLSELHWEEFSCRTSRMRLCAYNVIYCECFYLLREKVRHDSKKTTGWNNTLDRGDEFNSTNFFLFCTMFSIYCLCPVFIWFLLSLIGNAPIVQIVCHSEIVDQEFIIHYRSKKQPLHFDWRSFIHHVFKVCSST